MSAEKGARKNSYLIILECKTFFLNSESKRSVQLNEELIFIDL